MDIVVLLYVKQKVAAPVYMKLITLFLDTPMAEYIRIRRINEKPL